MRGCIDHRIPFSTQQVRAMNFAAAVVFSRRMIVIGVGVAVMFGTGADAISGPVRPNKTRHQRRTNRPSDRRSNGIKK